MERAIRPRHLAQRRVALPRVKGHAKLGAPNERSEFACGSRLRVAISTPWTACSAILYITQRN